MQPPQGRYKSSFVLLFYFPAHPTTPAVKEKSGDGLPAFKIAFRFFPLQRVWFRLLQKIKKKIEII